MKNGLKECRNVKKRSATAASVPRRLPTLWPAGARTAEQFVCWRGMAARRLENYHSPQMREIKGAEKRMIVFHKL